MKPMEEMMQAVRDWVNGKSEMLLKKTGNASKVTTVFSKHSSRTLPASGETLDTTMGKILKYLSDLKTVAFSGSYKDLSYRALRLKARYVNYSASAAYTVPIITGEAEDNLNKMWLIIGSGGAESTAGVHGTTDFARVYLVIPKIEASSVADDKGRTFLLLQLGSAGSTARYTIAATAATGPRDEKITLTIPKGSYAHVVLYEMLSNTNYVG